MFDVEAYVSEPYVGWWIGMPTGRTWSLAVHLDNPDGPMLRVYDGPDVLEWFVGRSADRDPSRFDAEGHMALRQLMPYYEAWRGGGVEYRDNPRPKEWTTLPPNTPYPCHSWEKRMVGKIVPGRGGGKVVSCATPREPISAAKRKSQVYIQGQGTMPRQRAANRIRQQGLKKYSTPQMLVAAAAAEFGARGSECPIPSPVGIEFPHALNRCDAEHPIWAGYRDAVVDAQEQAAVMSEGGGMEEWACNTLEVLKQHPQYPLWDQTARACAAAFEARERKRRGKAEFSTHREAAQHRARALASGMDVTSAEYLDSLRGGEGQRRRQARR